MLSIAFNGILSIAQENDIVFRYRQRVDIVRIVVRNSRWNVHMVSRSIHKIEERGKLVPTIDSSS